MMALTIQQPYAALIVTPQNLLPTYATQKRVENRGWFSGHRGALLIHAGKGRSYLESDEEDPEIDVYGFRIADLVFGAIVGCVKQVHCFHADDIFGRSPNPVPPEFQWLKRHEHTQGPWCHVYADAVMFSEPIPYSGRQGPFNIPDEVVAEQMRKAVPCVSA